MTRESSTPTLGGVMAAALDRRLAGLRTSIPARVLSYDEAACTVDVQPVVDEVFVNEEGERVIEAAPVLAGVPLMLYGSGGVRISIPVSVGDFVLVMFSHADIDAWLSLGGTSQPPGTDRRHHLSDAVALPGVMPGPSAGQASPQIRFTSAGTIEAGGDQPLALKSDVENLRTLVGAITTGPGPAVSTTGAPWLASEPVGTTVLKGS